MFEGGWVSCRATQLPMPWHGVVHTWWWHAMCYYGRAIVRRARDVLLECRRPPGSVLAGATSARLVGGEVPEKVGV